MNRRLALPALIALLAVAWTAVPCPAAEPLPVAHKVTLLVGSPAEDAAETEGVLIVPGTVIPLGGDVSTAKAGKRADELADIAQKLKASLRLRSLDVQYDFALPLQLNREHRLGPPFGSDLDLRVELVGAGRDVFTYRVSIADGSRSLADTNVTVPVGRRTVVGGLDGRAAPYVFLVIEPRREAGALTPGITPPSLVKRVHPEYTAEAKRAKIQGTVILEGMIGEDGRVSDVEVVKGLHRGLDKAAVDALLQWRFEPARDAAGKAVAVRYGITMSFAIQ
jgi:TonB family protein